MGMGEDEMFDALCEQDGLEEQEYFKAWELAKEANLNMNWYEAEHFTTQRPSMGDADARYIAALSPDKMIPLLERYLELEKEVENLGYEIEHLAEVCND